MVVQNILHEAFFSNYPEEAASVLESFSVPEILKLLPPGDGRGMAALVSCMTPSLGAEVLSAMPTDLASRTVANLSPVTAASLLHRLDEKTCRGILSTVPEATAREISSFMDYPPESVGRLMDPRPFVLPEDISAEEAISQLRSRGPKDIHDLYVVDRHQRLVGDLSLKDLMLLPGDVRLHAMMRRDLPTIHPMEHRDRIVELFNERKLLTIPVVDLDGQLLGVIRNRTILHASQEEATADLQTMVGASADERALSPPWFAVRKRLPWLQVNLLTAFLAAFVVGVFESTIAKFTALAVLLPVVAGQSGNTGAQSLAVVMRGLALRDIRPSQWLHISAKEVWVAFVNSVAVAATTCAAVYLWSQSWGLTMVIGISMVISMCMAGLSGALIPIALRALNQDPAQSSSIILTTVTDVVGFLSFLGLATVFASTLS
jgi:magnesium transporter